MDNGDNEINIKGCFRVYPTKMLRETEQDLRLSSKSIHRIPITKTQVSFLFISFSSTHITR